MKKRTAAGTMVVCAATLAVFSAAAGGADEPKVATLMAKDIVGAPGKEASMITVEYPPGWVAAAHRHNAHTFVYVLEGSVVMAVQGGKEMTLGPGQTFYESPDDVHSVSRNASASQPAKLLVFFVKEKHKPISTPAK
jgi:quercetin dioxygenase-like cupin family protein